jgi:glucose-6-phosphate 1-epimerase
VAVTEGEGGLPKVVLTHACGSSAEVYLFGACITSWKQPSGDEILYVRPDAVFTGVKPISGGIPHCFPQVRCHAVFMCLRSTALC